MSNWTHISGVLTVCPMGATQEEKEYVLKTVINHLPVVTGCEGDMECHIIQKYGHDTTTYCDEYGFRTNNLRYQNVRSRKYGKRELQGKYYIVVEGDFRDRYFEDTFHEFQRWICRLAKRVTIMETLVRIYDDGYGKEFVLSERDSRYRAMFECPSWFKSDSVNWCEHLVANYR